MALTGESRCHVVDDSSIGSQPSSLKICEVLPLHKRGTGMPSMRDLSDSSPEDMQEPASLSDAALCHHPPVSGGSSPTPTKCLEEHSTPDCAPTTNIYTVHKEAAVARDSRLGSSGTVGINGEMRLVRKSSKPLLPVRSIETSTCPPPDCSSRNVTNQVVHGEPTTVRTLASDFPAMEHDSSSSWQLAEASRLQFTFKEAASETADEKANNPLSVSNQLYKVENSGPSAVEQDLRRGNGRRQKDKTLFFKRSFPAMAQTLPTRYQLRHNTMLQRAPNPCFRPTDGSSPDHPPAQWPKSAFHEQLKTCGVTCRYNSPSSTHFSRKTMPPSIRPIGEVPRTKHLKNEQRLGSFKHSSPRFQSANVRKINVESKQRSLKTRFSGFNAVSNGVVESSMRKSRLVAVFGNGKFERHSNYDRDTCENSDHERLPDPATSFASEESADFVVRTSGDQVLFKEFLLYPLAFCLLISVALVCALLLLPTETIGSTRELTNDTCRSSSCFETARYLKDLLSWETADPCDDFYAFVCRRWKSHHVLAAHKGISVSFDDDYVAYLESKMHALVQDKTLNSDALLPLRQLHTKCVDSTGREEENLIAFQELMSQLSLQGFPFSPPMHSSTPIWEAAAKVLRKTGTSALLEVSVASTQSKPDCYDVVSVGPPEMVTASEGVDMNDAISLYKEAVFSSVRVFQQKHLPPENYLSIVRFAAQLEKIGDVKVWRKNSPKMDVVKSSPQLLEFLTELFRGINGSLFAGEGSEVMVLSPILMNKIYDLVHGTEVHTAMNYLAVRVIIGMSAFLPQAGLTNFYSTLTYARRQVNVPRWQLCIRVVEKALFPLVYTSLMDNLELRASITSFINRARTFMEAFQDVIEASPEFDSGSKTAIRRLISAVDIRVFGPDWVNNETLTQRYVQGLPLVPDNHSGLELYTKNYEYTFLASRALSSSSRWTRSVFSKDCWHELYPATLYAPLLLFDVTRVLYKHLAGLQHVPRAEARLGRCIFDLLVDVALTTRSSAANWLTENTEKRMRIVEACIYSPGGELSLRFKRLRDILAARAAHAYFRNDSWDKTTKLRLSDDHVLTGQQLFFIYLILQVCEYSATVQEGPSDGRDWEVALSNSDDFTDAFQCDRGSPMNPFKKCVF